MAFWSHLQELAGGSRGRIVRALRDAWHDEVRLAVQLSRHAEQVPYESSHAPLRELAERARARAGQLADELTRQGAAIANGNDGPPDREPGGGRNYWQRLNVDLEDLRAVGQRYRELAHHFDLDYPETAALFERLAHDSVAMGRVLTRLIALSDPHAAD
jgi:hypothetical protein